jgi:hypothetical protein
MQSFLFVVNLALTWFDWLAEKIAERFKNK